jgi:glucose-1-phosphate thymidylyltransferase
MKGILLAGGTGSRLHPVTRVVSKQLLPVYDKPMIYYPLSTLMLAGLREILVVSTPRELPRFQELLGNGRQWGLHLEYAEQPRPEGIPQALTLGRAFAEDGPVALALGDNLLYGHGLGAKLKEIAARPRGATVLAYPVKDPSRYGVIALDPDGRPLSLEEKPRQPKSRYAITGLYFFDERCFELAASLQPSARGELEIVDVLSAYLGWGELSVERLGRGSAWLDTGTYPTLHQAASFVQTLEERQGLKISCPEEIAFRMGFIDRAQLLALAGPLKGTDYGDYLQQLAESAP